MMTQFYKRSDAGYRKKVARQRIALETVKSIPTAITGAALFGAILFLIPVAIWCIK